MSRKPFALSYTGEVLQATAKYIQSSLREAVSITYVPTREFIGLVLTDTNENVLKNKDC